MPVLSGEVESVHSIVTSEGHVISGGVLSSMVMICKQVLLLPHESVAVQVLLMVYAWGHAPSVVTSSKVTTGAISQPSVALAIPVLSGDVESVHSMVTSAGQVISGAVISCTKIVALQVDELPQVSVAVHVLVIEYS